MEKRFSKGKHSTVPFFTALAIYTTSFDIVGVINLGSVTIRCTQLFTLPILIIWILNTIYRQKWKAPIAWKWLLIWIAMQFAFIFRSPNIKNALGYYLWLIFNVCVVFSTVDNCGKYYSFKWLYKTYINSIYVNAVIGLIQFVLFPIGINFFVTQNWTNKLARINGFTFEPSYFGTYLLPGFVILSYLKNSLLLGKKELKTINRQLLIICIAMILSSSRMCWLMIAVWEIFTLLRDIGITSAHYDGKIKKKRYVRDIILIILIVCGIIFVNYMLSKRSNSFLLAGLGIKGGDAHSTSERMAGLLSCLYIFRNSPWLGYGLGGVDPMIAQVRGVPFSILGNGAAMSIIGETLVANGLVGIFPFAIYITKIIKRNKSDSVFVKAFKNALVFELLILCFNQNILRPYVWWLIAICSASRLINHVRNQNEH